MLRLMESSTNAQYSASVAASKRDVTYSCSACRYDLNLNSFTGNTSGIGSIYGKSVKKGIISFYSIDENKFYQAKGITSFLSIDESRFYLSEDYTCLPHFISKHSCGLFRFRPRTKLLCRKCGNIIGASHDNNNTLYHLITDGSFSPSSTEVSVGIFGL